MDYKMYLAENVLNERRTVTYRALSRALKVHATKAKQYSPRFCPLDERKPELIFRI
ncbi:unnamed protein product [Penicillium pancosmium]